MSAIAVSLELNCRLLQGRDLCLFYLLINAQCVFQWPDCYTFTCLCSVCPPKIIFLRLVTMPHSSFPPHHLICSLKWKPTPVFLPGKSQGWRSLVGCSPWGRYELDTTEWLHFHFLVLRSWINSFELRNKWMDANLQSSVADRYTYYRVNRGHYWTVCCCYSVAQSFPNICDPMHTRLHCPPLSPGICSNSCPLSRWCYPTISSSVTPFSSCPQSFPPSGSFPVLALPIR